jgi:hypothetical protein
MGEHGSKRVSHLQTKLQIGITSRLPRLWGLVKVPGNVSAMRMDVDRKNSKGAHLSTS